MRLPAMWHRRNRRARTTKASYALDEALTCRCSCSVTTDFEAAHVLPFVPRGHPCSRVHGHSYLVSVTIEGDVELNTGWVMDFAEIDAHVLPMIEQLDHRLLNEVEGLENPTCELFARWIWTRLRALAGLVEVQVSETTNSYCRYTEQIARP